MVYKLTYFDVRGIAEPIRLMLVDNGIEFVDDRFQDEEWPEIKKTMPFGQAPLLQDGDLQLVQSAAILRYLAKKHGLAGKTDSEAALADMFYEATRDLHKLYRTLIWENYEAGREGFLAKTYPEQFSFFENLYRKFGNGEKFLVGNTLTYADYALFEELDIALILDGKCLEKFPLLKDFHGRMAARHGYKDYLEKRARMNMRVNGNGKQ